MTTLLLMEAGILIFKKMHSGISQAMQPEKILIILAHFFPVTL